MKKIALALSLSAIGMSVATSTQAQSTTDTSSVTVYGIINPSITYADKVANPTPGNATGTGSRFSMDSAVASGSRLGFKGVEDLGGGLKASFVIENGFNADTGTAAQGGLLFGRTATLGLSGSFGSVTLGRQKDYIDDLAPFNSALDFGSITNNIHAMNLDRQQGARVNNSIRYNSPVMAGVTLSALYGFGEQAGSTGAGQSFGFGGSYNNGPFSFGAAYFQNKLTGYNLFTGSSDAGVAPKAVTGSIASTSLKTFMVGGQYKIGELRFYGSFSQVKQPLAVAAGTAMTGFAPASNGAFSFGGVNNSKVNIIDIGTSYNLTSATKLQANYINSRAKFVGASDGKAQQVSLGVDYFLSKRTDIYAFFANIRSSDMFNPGIYVAPGAANTQNVLSVGLRHKF